MTIDEAKIKIEELNKSVQHLVLQFEQQTKLEVYGIKLIRIETFGPNHSINVELVVLVPTR